MLSENAKRELLAAGQSAALRQEFETMSANVRQADKRMNLDELLSFLTAADTMFGGPRQPPAHEPYSRALI